MTSQEVAKDFPDQLCIIKQIQKSELHQIAQCGLNGTGSGQLICRQVQV